MRFVERKKERKKEKVSFLRNVVSTGLSVLRVPPHPDPKTRLIVEPLLVQDFSMHALHIVNKILKQYEDYEYRGISPSPERGSGGGGRDHLSTTVFVGEGQKGRW